MIRGEITPQEGLEITKSRKRCCETGLDWEIGRELRRAKEDVLGEKRVLYVDAWARIPKPICVWCPLGILFFTLCNKWPPFVDNTAPNFPSLSIAQTTVHFCRRVSEYRKRIHYISNNRVRQHAGEFYKNGTPMPKLCL